MRFSKQVLDTLPCAALLSWMRWPLTERVEDGLEQRREEGVMMMRRVRDLEDSLANEQ